jgi:hypothetical protein
MNDAVKVQFFGASRLGSGMFRTGAGAATRALGPMTGHSIDFLLERERFRNSSTRTAFDGYAWHRAQQMALVAGWGGERIAVLGAGNCNDLDLATLADAFQEIHLFDIDARALAGAFGRQSERVKRVCHLHERDLTGVASLIERWRRQPPEPLTAQIEGWAALARLLREAGEFDAVLSTCLLSQVAINLRDFFGLTSALNTALLAAITGHILLAKALTKPSGRLLVTSDCITDQYPIREETSARGALDAIWYLTKQGAAFPGTSPALIADLLQDAQFSPPELKHAWLWDLNEQSYLVYAIETARRASD